MLIVSFHAFSSSFFHKPLPSAFAYNFRGCSTPQGRESLCQNPLETLFPRSCYSYPQTSKSNAKYCREGATRKVAVFMGIEQCVSKKFALELILRHVSGQYTFVAFHICPVSGTGTQTHTESRSSESWVLSISWIQIS